MKEELKSHFLNLYSMVMADGEVSPKEKTELYRIGKDEFGVSEQEFDKLVFSDEILFYTPESEREKITYLYDFALIAWADESIADEELHLLKTYARKFGVVEESIDPLVNLLIEKAKEHLSHEELMKEFTD